MPIDDYKLEKEVGRGSYGVTLLYEHKKDKKQVKRHFCVVELMLHFTSTIWYYLMGDQRCCVVFGLMVLLKLN